MSEWQPVETAPTCGPDDPSIDVLVYHADYGYLLAYCVNRDQEGESHTWHEMNGRIFDNVPTHWMPLPEPPK